MKKYLLFFAAFLVGIPLGFRGLSVIKRTYFEEARVLSKIADISLEISPTMSVSPTVSLTPTPRPKAHARGPSSSERDRPLDEIPTLTPTASLTVTPTLTPTPTPRPLISAPTDLEPLFEEFSITYSVEKNKLKFIAKCESNFNVGVWKEPYAGLYQFDEVTWTKYRNLMEKDPNINLRFGARESIETAAFVVSIGNERIWPTCSATY